MTPPLETNDPACPDSDAVDDVLDGLATPARSRWLREHVRGCERCLRRFGPRFELELWAPAALRGRSDESEAPTATVASTPSPTRPGLRARRSRRLRRAASLIAATGLLLLSFWWRDGTTPEPLGPDVAAPPSEGPDPEEPRPALTPGFELIRFETTVVRHDETRRQVLVHRSERPELVTWLEEWQREGEHRRRERLVPRAALR